MLTVLIWTVLLVAIAGTLLRPIFAAASNWRRPRGNVPHCEGCGRSTAWPVRRCDECPNDEGSQE